MFTEQLMKTGSQSVSPQVANEIANEVAEALGRMHTNLIHLGSNVSTMFDEAAALIDRLNSSLALFASPLSTTNV
ncbi:Protein of unknown function [Gryllus bimaculatus]|nr:Protein of unknown function [Gryllus bimaculatus]